MQPLYTMPVPPAEGEGDFACYQSFVRQMNRLTMPSVGDRLRLAIEETAHAMGTSPAHIARILVGYGLRAPRHAFPPSFVDHVDRNAVQPKYPTLRNVTDFDLSQLRDYWAALRPAPVGERVMETA